MGIALLLLIAVTRQAEGGGSNTMCGFFMQIWKS